MSADYNYFDKMKTDLSFGGNKAKEAECLTSYDKDGDGALDVDEFHDMCLDLLVEGGDSTFSRSLSKEIFDKLDEDQDGRIDEAEFHILWKYWLPMILCPKSALIVVDVQNDFIDGSLAVENGEAIVPLINRLLDTVQFERVIYTFDWHPEDHISFHKNLPLRQLHPSSPLQKEEANLFDTVIFQEPVTCEQTLWPAHCIIESSGAELHPGLKIVENRTFIYKGCHNHIDSYSAFFDNQRLHQTELPKELCSRRITDIYICGLAFDVCVRHTAIDGAHLGFRTFVLEDGCKGITEDGCQKARKDMEDAGCLLIQSSQVQDMVMARTRIPRMALIAACNVAEARLKAKDKLALGSSAVVAEPPTRVNGSEITTLLLDL